MKNILSILLIIAVVVVGAIAQAQQVKKIPRIGFLVPGSAASYSGRIEAFRRGLRDLGHVEGKDIVIEYRYAEGKLERLPDFAAELIRSNLTLSLSQGLTPPQLLKTRPRRSP
jgi:putative ABC transport system substrate-binding protein